MGSLLSQYLEENGCLLVSEANRLKVAAFFVLVVDKCLTLTNRVEFVFNVDPQSIYLTLI